MAGRHAYLAGTDGQRFDRITRGDFDVIQVAAADEKNGWLYFTASPDNPTQHYLYRQRLSGGTRERLSPASQPGWHDLTSRRTVAGPCTPISPSLSRR